MRALGRRKTPIESVRRPAVALLLAAVFSGLFVPAPRAHAAEPEDLSWIFSKDKHVTQYWEQSVDPSDARVAHIRPRFGKPEDRDTRVLTLIPKKSSSYHLALQQILMSFHAAGLRAEFKIAYFRKNNPFALEMLNAFEQRKGDLVFAMGSVSMSYVAENYKGREIPVVTLTNKDPVALGYLKDYEKGSGTNIAFTSLNIPIEVQWEYLHEIRPELRNVCLMFNQANTQVVKAEVEPARKWFAGKKVVVTEVGVTSREAAPEELAREIPLAMDAMRKRDPDLKDSLFWVTSSTAVFSNFAIVNEHSGKVPVLVANPTAVTEGDDSAVIGIGIDRRNNAHLAALYGIRILRGGEKPGAFPVGIVRPPDLAINFKVARRIGLRVPFRFVEAASFIYDADGRLVRNFGSLVGVGGNR